MKNAIWAVLAVLVSSLTAVADNKITMVTYFPTPYMAYKDITVTGPCDIGLINDCRLTVAKDLQVDSMSVGQGATLTLKGHDAQANALQSGQGAASRGSLVFEGTLIPDTLPGQVKALETEEGTLTGLKLGSKAFPACNATGNKISWKNLTINNQEGVYLVCGDGTAGALNCDASYPKCEKELNGQCKSPSCDPSSRHLDENCQCVCNNTPASCGNSEWAAWGVNSDCTCSCGTCTDSYNGRSPQVGDTCYMKSIDGMGNFYYKMGVVTGDPTCRNCVRNITCELPGLGWKMNTTSTLYVWADQVDAWIAANSKNWCRAESDLGNRTYYQVGSGRFNQGSEQCKNAIGTPSYQCQALYFYECVRTEKEYLQWKHFQYGYPPCYPNC